MRPRLNFVRRTETAKISNALPKSPKKRMKTLSAHVAGFIATGGSGEGCNGSKIIISNLEHGDDDDDDDDGNDREPGWLWKPLS